MEHDHRRGPEPPELDSEVLTGGCINAVTRRGATVRRTPAPNADFAHALLEHLAVAGWSGAPRFLGTDAALRALTLLVREFHDLTAGTPLAGRAEVVCHNDLDPRNTVYRDEPGGPHPVGIIDWGLAAPGPRLHDVARIAWQFLPLGPDVSDLRDTARRLRVVCDTYGVDGRGELLDAVLWWQERCWRGIRAGAEAGDPAMSALVRDGVVEAVRAAQEWTSRNRRELEAPGGVQLAGTDR